MRIIFIYFIKFFKLKNKGKNITVFFLLFYFLLGSFFISPERAFAADVTIDSAAVLATSRCMRSVVWTSSTTGYYFFIDSDSDFKYYKTTDGGESWGSPVTVKATETITSCDVWYDQWTPGDSGNLIHVWYVGTGADDVVHESIDTSNSDAQSSEHVAFTGSSATAARGSFVSGAKARGGYLLVAYDIDAGAEFGTSRSIDAGVNWTARTSMVEATIDQGLMFPGNEADNQDMWLLYHDASANELTLKVHDDSANTNSESASILTLTEQTTDGTGQYGFAGTIRDSDNHLLVVTESAYDSATGDMQTWDINGTGSIVQKTAIATDKDDMYYPSIYTNNSTDEIYVAYIGEDGGTETLGTSTGVYYKVSTDGMANWGSEQAYSTSASDFRQTWVPIMGPNFNVIYRDLSDQAIYTNYDNSIKITCTSQVTSGNWNTAGTWNCGHVPTTSEDVVIRAGDTITMDVSSAVVRNITINGTLNTSDGTSRALSGKRINISSTGTLTANASTITLSGTAGTLFTKHASGTFTAGTSTVTLSGNGTATINSGDVTFNNLTSSGTGTKTLSGTVTVGGDLTVSAGTFQISDSTLAVTGATSITGTLDDSSTTGTNTFVGAVTVNNGGTWTSTGNESYTFRGGLTVNSTSTFTSGSGTYTFDTNAQTIDGTQTYTITNVTNNITSGNGLTLSGSTATITTLTQGTSAVLTLSGTVPTITTLTATASPNTVQYTSGSAQTMTSTTYHHLTLSGSATKTLGGNATINGTLTVGTGSTFDPTTSYTATGSGTNTLDVTGTIKVQHSTFTGSYASFETKTFNTNSTVDYALAGTQTLDSSLSYYNLTQSGTGTKTPDGNITATGALTLSAGTLNTTDPGTTVLFEGAGTTDEMVTATTDLYNPSVSGTLTSLTVDNVKISGSDVSTKAILKTTGGNLDCETPSQLLSEWGATSDAFGATVNFTGFTGADCFISTDTPYGFTFLNGGSFQIGYDNGPNVYTFSAGATGTPATYDVSAGSIVMSGGTLTANTSTISLTGTGTVFNYSSGTFTAGTSTLKLTDTSSTGKTFAGGGQTYGTLWLAGGGGGGAYTISGSNTFTEFKDTSTAAHIINFTAGTTTTLSTWTVSGTVGNVVTLQSTSGGSAFTLSDSAGTNVCDYCSIQDSTAGGGATWNATNSDSVSGNTGWNFGSIARYWVGGTASWDGTAGSKWATSSGGAGGASVPTAANNVYFDASSGSGTVTIATTGALGLNVDFSGFTGTLAGSTALTISGNLTMASGMTNSYTGDLTFDATSGTKTITSNGKTFGSNIIINGSGGTFTPGDAFNTSANLTITAGTFALGANNVTIGGTTSVTGTLNDASATGTNIFTGGVTVNNGGTWSNSNNPAFEFRGGLTVNSTSTFSSGSGTYTFSTNAQTIGGTQSYTITNLTNNITSGAGLTFSGQNPTVTTLTQGTNAILTFSGTVPTITTLTATTTGNTVRYTMSADATIKNTTYYNLTVGGSGIKRPNSANLTINGTLDVSAGTLNTNVPSQTVLIQSSGTIDALANSSIPVSHTAVASGTITNLIINGVKISGSDVDTNIDLVGTGGNLDCGTDTKSLSAWGATNDTFGAPVNFDNFTGTECAISSGTDYGFQLFQAGSYQIGYETSSDRYVFTAYEEGAGTDYNVTAANISLTGGTLIANSSTVTLTGTGSVWNYSSGTVTAGTSTIKLTDTSSSLKTFVGGGQTYNNIWYSPGSGTGTFEVRGSNTFADFKDDGTQAHSILFTAGTTTTLTSWTVTGNAGQLITINSGDGAGGASTSTHTLSDSTGTNSSNYLSVQHSVAGGGASWYAGANSTDNNSVATAGSGWIFTNQPCTACSLTINNSATTNAGSAPNWVAGTGGGNVNITDILTYLDAGASVSFTATGDITVSNAFTKSSGGAATMTMYADENIIVNAAIASSAGALSMVLNADRDANTSGYVNIAGALTSNGGNITIGGGSGTISAGSGFAVGNSGQATGVLVNGVTVAAGGGIAIVNGQGYNTSTNGNYGVRVTGASGAITTTSSGTIDITGNGSGNTNSGSDYGLYVDTGGVISSVNGDLTVNNSTGGGAGTGTNNFGVYISGTNSTIKTTGSGNISVTGTGGNVLGSGTGNHGVYCRVSNCIQTTSTGTLTVTGTGGNVSGAGSGNGIYLDNSASITANGSSLTLNGFNNKVEGNSNAGIFVDESSYITNSGNGDINITATSGGGDDNNNSGIDLRGESEITTVDGDITISGTNTASGAGSDNYGIYIHDNGLISTTTGDVTLTGISDANTNENHGVHLTSNPQSILSGGNLTLISDIIGFHDTFDYGYATAGGDITVRPYTASTTIGVGNGSGTLTLSDTDLGQLYWGSGHTLTIGGASAGDIDIDTGSSILDKNVTFLTGGNISLATTALAHTGASAATLNLLAYGNITTTSAITAATSALTININADYDANASGTISIGAGVSSNGGTITITGGGGTISTTSAWDNLTMVTGSNTVTLGANTSISGALTITSGTLALSTRDLTVTGTTSISGTLNDASATGTNIFTGGVTVNNGGTWSNSNNPAFEFRGGLTVNSTSTFSSGSGTYTFSTNAQSIGGTQSYTITNLSNTISSGNGLTFSTNNPTVTTLTQGTNAVLTFSGTVPTITTLTATASPNTVQYTGGTQTVKGATYHHLTSNASSGWKTLGGNVVLNGDLYVAGDTGGLELSTYDLTVNGSTTISVGDINYANLSDNSSSGTNIFVGNVTINGGGWASSGNSAFSFRGGLTASTDFFSSGSGVYTFDTNAQTISGNTGFIITNLTNNVTTGNGLTLSTVYSIVTNLTQGTNAVLTFSGTVPTITTLAATASGNTVVYTGSSQTIIPATYNHLTLNGGSEATQTLSDDVTVNGQFNVISGTFDPTSSYSVTGSGTNVLDVTGTIKVQHSTLAGSYSSFETINLNSGSTVDYSLNGTQTILNTPTYYNLTLSSGGTKSLAGAGTIASGGTVTVSAGTLDPAGYLLTGNGSNTLTIASGATLDVDASTFAGNYSAGFGTINLNSGSTVDYSLNGTQTILNTPTYYNLTLSGGGTKSLAGAGTIASGGTVTVSAGTLDPAGYLLTGNGSNTLTIASGATLDVDASTFAGNYSAGFGTINLNSGSTTTYSRAGDQTISNSPTYHHFTVSGSGTKSLAGATTVNGAMTLSGGTLDTTGSAYDINASSITISGGTFIPRSSIISITGSGNVWNYNSGTFTPGSSVIKFTDSSSGSKTFAGGGQTYNNFWYAPGAGTGTLIISGSNTFNYFKDDGTSAHTVQFTAGTTTTISSWNVNGGVGNLISLNSTTPLSTWTIYNPIPGYAFESDYLSIRDSVASGLAVFYAGDNSVDDTTGGSANSGWIFTKKPRGGGISVEASANPDPQQGGGGVGGGGGVEGGGGGEQTGGGGGQGGGGGDVGFMYIKNLLEYFFS